MVKEQGKGEERRVQRGGLLWTVYHLLLIGISQQQEAGRGGALTLARFPFAPPVNDA